MTEYYDNITFCIFVRLHDITWYNMIWYDSQKCMYLAKWRAIVISNMKHHAGNMEMAIWWESRLQIYPAKHSSFSVFPVMEKFPCIGIKAILLPKNVICSCGSHQKTIELHSFGKIAYFYGWNATSGTSDVFLTGHLQIYIQEKRSLFICIQEKRSLFICLTHE